MQSDDSLVLNFSLTARRDEDDDDEIERYALFILYTHFVPNVN